MKNERIIVMVSLAACAGVNGQLNTFDFVVSNVISLEQPSATIEVWARFDPSLFAFAFSSFGVYAWTDEGNFSDPRTVLAAYGGIEDGEISPDGDSVAGIFAGQLVLPPNYPGDPSNPILLWSATWTASEFTPRNIGLRTIAENYFVYLDPGGEGHNFIDESFSEGIGTIKIVPSSAAVLVLGGLVGVRRKRL